LIASAIVHPFLVVTAAIIATDIALQKPLSTWQSAMLIVDLSNIACGYASFLLLGWQSLTKLERKAFWKVVLFTPVYWMIMSLAAWRAVIQLWLRPHHWEKTPHKAQGRVANPASPAAS
jgi:hypothetical protein